MTARKSLLRLIKAGKEFVRDILKPSRGTKVKAPCEVFQQQKDVHQQVPHQTLEFIHSKSTLFSKIIPRIYYQSQARELRRWAAQRSWGRGSSPLFAFAGFAVLCNFKNKEEFVIDQIREMGKTAQEHKPDSQLGQFSYLSLESFLFGKMIGQGCYATVYEARLKDQSVPAFEGNKRMSKDDGDIIIIDQSVSNDAHPESRGESDSDIDVIDQLVSDIENNNNSVKSDPESKCESYSDSDIIMTDKADSGRVSIDIVSDKLDPEFKIESDSDSDIMVIDQSVGDSVIIGIIGDKPDPEFKGYSTLVDNSISTIVEFSEEDGLGNKEFKTPLSSETVAADGHLHELNFSLAENSFVILPQSDKGEKAEQVQPETSPPKYSFAIKIMYNYQIESKASAILRGMEKEMVPAKLATTLAQMKEWENGNKVRKKSLPPHPNIVNMWGVFVDYFPLLSDGLEHYPAALPKRLNPDGIGRNQTLFLVMQKYDMNLYEYLQTRQPDMHTRILLLAQLLEGVDHMGRCGIAHRDMKNDNILLDCSTGEVPQLVISDFGCCLADSQYGLKLPYPTDEVDRGGNPALMAPEISNAMPGPNKVLDYSKSDLWSVGTLAYEIFGQNNPFYPCNGVDGLDSQTYKESDLPSLPDSVPLEVKKLVSSLLQRDPCKRPTPEVAIDAISLYLWAPSHWWLPGIKVRRQEVRWWLAFLAAEVYVLQLRQSEFTPELYLKATFLSHLCMDNIQAAIDLMQMRR